MFLLLLVTYLCMNTSPHTLRLEFYQLPFPYIVEVGRNSHLSWLMVWSANVNALFFNVVSTCACIIHIPAFISGTYNVIVVSSYSCTTSRHSSVFPPTALGFRSIACFLFDSTSSSRLMIRAHLEEPLRPLVEGMSLRAHPLSLHNCNSVSINRRSP